MTALLTLAASLLLSLLPLYRTVRAMEREAGWWEARTAEVEAAFAQVGRARGRAERRVPREWKEAA